MPKPSSRTVHAVMRALARAIDHLELPAVEKIAEDSQQDPFEVLIGTMLSAQTRDPVTAAASERLFRVARTPRTMAQLTAKQIEKLIYPVSFYRHKAKHVRETCRILADRFGGRVPATMEELLVARVGRKTASLVLISFRSLKNIASIPTCRISNRLGWVRTRTPDETEQAYDARTVVALYQPLLVTWGQNVCRPIYPRCGTCAIRPYVCRSASRRWRSDERHDGSNTGAKLAGRELSTFSPLCGLSFSVTIL
jgi:endonuclease-3